MHAHGTRIYPLPATGLQHIRCVKHERQTAVSAKASSACDSHPQCSATDDVETDLVDSHALANSTTDHARLPTVSRRDLLRGAVTGTLVNSAPVVLHESFHVLPAEAIPTSYKLPAIGQAALGTYNLGVAAVRDPALYRGMATAQAVRSELRMHGLVPYRHVPLQLEIDRAYGALQTCSRAIDQYQALAILREQNQDAFFGLLSQNLNKLLPVIYTPTVGDACKQWSTLMQRPQGLYVCIKDKGNVRALVRNWPSDDVKIAVVTDGERILGLGDLGINGMGIPVGKAMVYTAAAGLQPHHVLPIQLDVGCNTAEVRDDPLYMGLQQERVRGREYDELIDELIVGLRERYGANFILHWEDFNVRNSFRLLDKYVAQGVCTFNDDIQSTAAAVVGAVYGALRLDGVPPLKDQVFLFFGAGQANIGTARLLVAALVDEGLTETEAKKQMWLYDSKGLVYEGRPTGRLTPQKMEFARSASEGDKVPSGGSLLDAVQQLQPSALIGAAAKQNAFTADTIKALTKGVQSRWGRGSRPIVLALSNPSEVAECTAQQAYNWSGGKAVYASGTAFPPFQTEEGMNVPAQANNSLIFPGVGLGCIAAGAKQITSDIMLAAAKAAAIKLTAEELQQQSILPEVNRISQVGLGVAAAVACCIKATQHAGEAATQVADCLPATSDVLADKDAFRKAEHCIAGMQYNPFFPQCD
ncbi:TPA: hypothetical protein ACH3X3_009203 [Trebouxia sp. C0006]